MSEGGIGLVNLVAELERRLAGSAGGPGLRTDLAEAIADAPTYVLVVFDGLGIAQLDHVDASGLRRSVVGTIQAPFPTTTSVAMSSIATAMTPAEHGLVAHLMWRPEIGQVVNTLKWVNLAGEPVPHDYSGVLPPDNTWERLRRAGIEPITVQPGQFMGSPLSRLLYRGARFEPAWDDTELVEATVQLARSPGRFIFTYVWQVDYAGHVHGLESPEFAEALRHAARVWDELASRLPPNAALIGTADHGLIEYDEHDKIIVREPRFESLRFGGDARGVQLWGDIALIEDFIDLAGASRSDPPTLFSGLTSETIGDAIALAPPGKVILPPGFDKRLRCYHGGLESAEVDVPLLIG